MHERWRVPPQARVDLTEADAASTPGAPGDKEETQAATLTLHEELRELQLRLWAESRRSLLVVLQGTDASGKDGTITHVFQGLNPLGTRVASFKEPTPVELAHDFLWRVHAQAPAKGEVVIFNRSHYEDVLVVRVHRLATEEIWRARYGHIRAFEELLASAGTTVVKVFLHISKQEQGERLRERAERPDKRWKYRPEDLAERDRWDDYRRAFEEMLRETSTENAPWHVVPADRKWYRNWAVSSILLHTLNDLDPRYPE